MAGLQPEDIDYVNAHGTGTPNNDLSESNALRRVFPGHLPPVSSTKSFTGHATSASGGIEMVICLLALSNQFIPANLGWETQIPGIFACGNVLHVHDLADYASDEAALAGRHILDYLNGKRPGREFPVTAGGNLRYVTPNEYIPGEKTQFFMRSLIVEDDAELIVSLDGQEIMRKKLRFVKPPEMLSVEVPGELTARGGQLSFALNGGGR